MEIYTTGAYLMLREIEGRWHWVVTAFEDPCYYDGKEVEPLEVYPSESANKEREIIEQSVTRR